MKVEEPPVASQQDGTYPRPQLIRSRWIELGGEWDFGFGDDPVEAASCALFDRVITVPYPPESSASGIGDTGFHHVAWYRRSFGVAEIHGAGYWDDDSRILLHFGAVDWAADVWVNEIHVGHHDGGQSPFSFDVTNYVNALGENWLVVRAVDDPHDVSIPRGKQDWREQPHVIWYHRTTGIWQPVWLEAVAPIHVADVAWESDVPASRVSLEVTLNRRPTAATWARVRLSIEGELLAETHVHLLDQHTDITMSIARQKNGQQHEELLWSPDHPRLIDALIVIEQDGSVIDAVSSYFGLRSVRTGGREFLLNDHPFYLRSVLSQNYWPESHLAAPSAAALRREVELIKELGFNCARVHQKAEDPRFLFWADRLGLLIWGETASAYEFNARAVAVLTAEWIDLVRRDRSHPSIVAWVPLNESWGVQHISHDGRQRAFSRAITDLTRALDSSRPVVSNDGWEHTSSDIWTIHDYESDPDTLTRRYESVEAVSELLEGFGPAGRRMSAGQDDRGQPVMLTEFGGVSYPRDSVDGSWGYSTANSAEQFESQVSELLRAALSSSALSGFCYTQLTDTGQETNGLLFADRTPKVPTAGIRKAILGDRAGSHRTK